MVTRYAHHVFKAFDVTGSGSISFKAGNKFTLKQKYDLYGFSLAALLRVAHFNILHLAPNFSYIQIY